MKAKTIIYISNLLQEHSDHRESVYQKAYTTCCRARDNSDSNVDTLSRLLDIAREKRNEASYILEDWNYHDWH